MSTKWMPTAESLILPSDGWNPFQYVHMMVNCYNKRFLWVFNIFIKEFMLNAHGIWKIFSIYFKIVKVVLLGLRSIWVVFPIIVILYKSIYTTLYIPSYAISN